MINALNMVCGPLVERIGWSLIHFLWQGAAIAAVLAVVLLLLRYRSPHYRYLAAWTALLSMTVCLPITAWMVTSISVAESTVEKRSSVKELSHVAAMDSEARPANNTLSPDGQKVKAIPEQEAENADRRSLEKSFPSKPMAPLVSPVAKPDKPLAKTSGELSSFWQMLKPTLPWVVSGWLVGTLLVALWHLLGYRHLARLKKQSITPPPSAIEQSLHRLAARMKLKQVLGAFLSPLVEVPTVVGWIRPVILLPLGILGEMPPEQLEMILAHELAHILRRDYLWNLLQIAIETLLFYHPAVWWVSRRIREERENCCDREAVSVMGNPVAYANALVRLAEIHCQREASAAPACSIAADGGKLETRIRHVLGLPVGSSCGSPAWLGGILALLLLATIFSVSIAWAGGKVANDKTPSSPEKKVESLSLSMTAEAFSKLSNIEQRDVLVRTFQQHLENGKNLFYETEQIYRAFEDNKGEAGKPVTKYPSYYRYLYRYWRLGDSYKTEMFQYDDPKEADLYRYSANAENAEEGIGRNASIFKYQGEKHIQGQVVYPHKQSIDEQFGTFPSPDYLMGASGSQQNFFQYLIGKKDKYEIKSPVSGNKVQLIIPWHGDKQTFELDPQKGFLPIRFDARWEIPATKDREGHWSETKFEVQESRLVDNVWIPVKMASKSTSSSNVLVIQETKVLRIESGSVKPADLLLPFTEGAKVADIIEGVSYTTDAQGNAIGVKDDPNWKHDPPKDWRRGKVEEAYSMASKISPIERKRLVDERDAKWKPIDEALKVLRANPPASQEDRMEAALKILRVYRVSEREGDWATAIRELITIGKPAVPKLIEELDRSENDRQLRAMCFVLRGIDDHRAVPALIRAIPRLIQPSSSDFGLTIKNNPVLLEFMWKNDVDHIRIKENRETNGLTLFSYSRPIREIMPTLEKMTGQSFNWRELNFAEMKAEGIPQQRRQCTLFLDHAKKWNDWWSKNWKNFVMDEADAQLAQTQKSLDQFAELIAKMPQLALATAIPWGLNVHIAEGWSCHEFDLCVNLDIRRQPSDPGELLKNSPKDHPSPQLLAWAEREGVDLLRIEIKPPGDGKTYYGYQPVGMKVWKIDNKRLTNLEKELQESKKLELPPLWEGPISSVDKKEGEINEEEPATFLFITREGTCGTIQIRSGLHHDFVIGLPVMGPPVFEYNYIYESEPDKTTAGETKSTVIMPAAASTDTKPDPTSSSGKETTKNEAGNAEQAEAFAGVVHLPDGKPAAGAQVVVATSRTPVALWNGRPTKLTPVFQADKEGRFSFKPPSGLLDSFSDYHLIALHELGFGDLSEAEFDKSRTITLKPWGQLEGTVKIGRDPAKNVDVEFVLEFPDKLDDFVNAAGFRTTTDEQGRFTLKGILPGKGFATRAIRAGYQNSWTNRVAVEIFSGKTAHVEIGGRGRPVVGRIDASQTSGPFVQKGSGMLYLLTQQKSGLHQGYYFHAKEDGSFRMEDVPPGEYSFSFYMSEPMGNRGITTPLNQPKMLGRANGVITVPEIPDGYSDQPLDIGTYKVNRPAMLKAGDAVPDVTLVSLDGKKFRLTEQQGKVTLISFWYPTLQLGRDELPNLKRIYERFGKEQKFVMIGFSFESKPESLAEVAKKEGLNWPQVCFGTSDEFGISSAFFDSHGGFANVLVGPDGKIIAGDLRGEKLDTAVKAAIDRCKSPLPEKSTDNAAQQSNENQSNSSEPPPALLSAKGTVLDDAGKPLAGAKVYLREWSTFRISTDPWERHPKDVLAEVQTDATGTFAFQDIPAKTLHNEWIRSNPWDIVVTAQGYSITWRHFSASKMTDPMVLKLSREAKVSGKLVDDKGQPIQGIEISVLNIDALGSDLYGFDGSPERLDLQCSQLRPTAKTDVEGSVSLSGVPQNCRLILFVEDESYRPEMIFVATTDQPQPDIMDRSYDSDEKKPHRVFSTRFNAELKPSCPRLVGQITAADTGKPLPLSKVEAYWKGRAFYSIADESGKFHIPNVPIPQCILLVNPPEKTDYLGQSVPVSVPQDQKEVEVKFALPIGQEVRGEVVDAETGKGIAGMGVYFHSDAAHKPESQKFYRAPPVVTDADGKFRLLASAEKGNIILSASENASAIHYDIPHFKADEKNQDPRYSKEIEIVADKQTPEVKFAIPSIRPGDGPLFYASLPIRPTVEGQAVDADGKSVAGAEVGMKRWFTEKENELRIARTDENGRFTLRNIPTNDYDQIKIVHRDRKLCGYARVPADEKVATTEKPLELKLSSTGSIIGRVMEGDKPITGAHVQVDNVLTGEKSVNFEVVRTDANGRFEFLQLPADQSVRVHVFFAEYEYATTAGAGIGDSQEVQLKPGENLELKPFQFVRANLSIAGIVVDPDGKPVEGATVSVDARSGSGFYGAFTREPTGKDGRFTISNIPNVPLKVMAYVRPVKDSPDNRIHFPAHVDAEPGQQDVEIVLDPKLVHGKK